MFLMNDYSSNKSVLFEEIESLKKKINSVFLPNDLYLKTEQMLNRLQKMAKYGVFIEEFEKISHYIDWLLALPWQKKTEDILDLNRAKEILDKNHYGLWEIKERVLEYLAVLKLKAGKEKISRAPILCLAGLVGTGKTTLAYSLAEVLGRKFVRIPFGGMGSARDLRGQSRLHLESEPGQLIKALRRAQSNNPVFLLDEIDRVAVSARADVMGVLVEVLDPEQNEFFIDHYLDYPFDLSNVLFVATCNNTSKIATAVLDRMEIWQMPSYSDEEKIVIAKKYLLPKALKEAGLTDGVLVFAENLWPQIIRPLGFDPGMRSLERTLQAICRKVAKKIVLGEGNNFYITLENFKEYIPK